MPDAIDSQEIKTDTIRRRARYRQRGDLGGRGLRGFTRDAGGDDQQSKRQNHVLTSLGCRVKRQHTPRIGKHSFSSRESASKYNCAVTKPKDDASDAEAFINEMADVTPLAPDPRGRSHSRPPLSAPVPVVTSTASDDLYGPDEEFAVPGVNRGELRKLKRGDYPAQDQMDLHGMTAADAVASAGRFLDESRQRRHRCVCIVHGRGAHSDGNVAVLKASVRAHLRSHRSVLAYTDAPRSDGGTGAVYVLLRK